MSRFNWPIGIIGFFWWWLETSFFGWNMRPESVAELFADGLVFAFFAAAYAVGSMGVNVNVKNVTIKETP